MVLRSAVLSLLLAMSAGVPPLANAAQPIMTAAGGITRLEITRVESPTFAGRTFGNVGQYVKLVGQAYGEVDPSDPRNRSSPISPSRPETRRAWWSTSPTCSF